MGQHPTPESHWGRIERMPFNSEPLLTWHGLFFKECKSKCSRMVQAGGIEPSGNPYSLASACIFPRPVSSGGKANLNQSPHDPDCNRTMLSRYGSERFPSPIDLLLTLYHVYIHNSSHFCLILWLFDAIMFYLQ